MNFCPNKSHPDWKYIVENSNETTAYKLYILEGFNIPTKEKTNGYLGLADIKPGVSELFESNPELAQSVYEALGFEIPTTELQGKKAIEGKIVSFDVIEELASNERENIPSAILIKKLLNKGFLPKINETDIILGGVESGIWKPNIKRIEASGGNKSTLAKKIGHELLHSVTHNIIYSYQALKGDFDFSTKYNVDNIRQGYIKPVELNKTQIEALDNLVRLRNKVIDYINENKESLKKEDRGFGTYDYFIRTNYTDTNTDLHEFISEVFTNPELINILKEIPTEGKKSNLFKDFVDAIAKILGFTNTSILEDVIAYSEEAFFQQPQITPQQKQQAISVYSQYLDSLNKPNTNPILQNNQQEQVKKFAELQERLNNKEFLEGAKNAYENSEELKSFGTQKEYTDYIARVSLGIVKNPSSGEYNYTSKVKDIVYHGTNKKFDKFLTPNRRFSDWSIELQKMVSEDSKGAIYFTNRLDLAQNSGKNIKANRIINAILNIKNPKETITQVGIDDSIPKLKKEGFDSYLYTNNKANYIVQAVFEPEQVHILGGIEDIEGFKEFVNNQTNVQYQKQIDLQIEQDAVLEEFANSLSERFNISFDLISEEETKSMLPEYANEPAFFDPKTKKAYLVKNRANKTSAVHEIFTHPFLLQIEKTNPTLYKNLLKEAKNNKSVVNYVNNLYGTNQNNDHEYIARAIDLVVQGELDQQKDKTLLERIQDFFKQLSDYLKQLFNIPKVFSSAISPNITLQQLTQFVMYGKGKMNLNPAQENIEYSLKATNVIVKNLDKIKQWEKNKSISENVLWNKIQELGVPKEQLELIKNSEGNTVEEKLLDFVNQYSYAVEINTAKETNLDEGEDSKEHINLNVPGGTNYKINVFKTPLIIPSIINHFFHKNQIGWFRSDDKMILEDTDEIDEPYYNDEEGWVYDNTKKLHIPTKTRRILEVQSDWGQKQRKSSEPDINIKYDIQQIINDLQKSGDLKIDCN